MYWCLYSLIYSLLLDGCTRNSSIHHQSTCLEPNHLCSIDPTADDMSHVPAVRLYSIEVCTGYENVRARRCCSKRKEKQTKATLGDIHVYPLLMRTLCIICIHVCARAMGSLRITSELLFIGDAHVVLFREYRKTPYAV